MRSPPGVVVLLWHGRGPREADVFASLIDRLRPDTWAITPQWDSRTSEHGRTTLLDSLADARDLAERHGCPLVVGGWSLGATAALSAGLHPQRHPGIAAVLGLAVDPHARSPLTGAALLEEVGTARSGPAIRLAHGLDDDVVPVAPVQALARQLGERGHDVHLEVAATDHAGILGTRYCPTARRCLPSSSWSAATGLDTAAIAAGRADAAARARRG